MQQFDFINELELLACQSPARLALPESLDPRVLKAALRLRQGGSVKELWLFAEPEHLPADLIKVWGDGLRLMRPSDAAAQAVVSDFFKARFLVRGKSLAAEELDAVSRNPLYQAAYLLASEKIDAAVAGCVETTAAVIRAALAGLGLAPGIKTLSGSFMMVRGSERLLFADCGVVIEPSVEQLVDIAEASVATWRALCPMAPPIVAFLSFATKGSALHPSASKMSLAAEAFKVRCPDIICDGELQFDAAYVPEVSLRKAPSSPVAGRANCLIFPDLGAGNIAYKIAQRLAGFSAYGPILQGASRPYHDLSRGASAEDILASSLIAFRRSTHLK